MGIARRFSGTLALVSVAGISLIVTACGPNGPNKTDTGLAVGAIAGGLLGNTVGRGNGRIATTAIGAVIGGIVGSEIGRSLDKIDRQYAQQAEFAALERGRSGERVEWRNPDSGRYGEVVPSPPYKRGEIDCRDYTHKIYIDGQPQAMRGTACRNPDGTWSNVS
jgi:surface antigen